MNPDLIKAKLRSAFDTLKQHADDATRDEIDTVRTTLFAEIDQEQETIFIDFSTKQRLMYWLAGALVIADERRSWYYFHAITLVLAIPEVETIVRRKYGTAYNDFRDRMTTYGTIVNNVKVHFDMLEKSKTYGQQGTKEYTACMHALTKLPLIWQELDAIFYLLCRYTNLGNMTVPDRAIHVLAQEYKKVKYDVEKKEQTFGDENNG